MGEGDGWLGMRVVEKTRNGTALLVSLDVTFKRVKRELRITSCTIRSSQTDT